MSRFAYADPPYLGQCKLYDHFHGDDGRCWNEPDTHKLLIARLCDDYPDGWAMSASSPSLRVLLPMCPTDIRIGAWAKSFGAFKRGVRPAYMWEPVIYRGGNNPPWMKHPPPPLGGKQTTPKDFTVVHEAHEQGTFVLEPITLKKGLTGAKPPKVCDWILDLLNVLPGDTLDDLYPGTRVMSERAALRLDEATRETT